MVRETTLTHKDLIYPLFVTEGTNTIEPVPAMPGVSRYSMDSLAHLVEDALQNQLRMFAIFPVVPKHLKSEDGSEAYNPDNLVCSTIKYLKKLFGPSLALICDVALDPYTTHGHDGLFKKNKVANDETLEALAQQALTLAAAGCDIVAPSDMMDGRIGYIRKMLDNSLFYDTMILSYAAKYASSFYGPFRKAIGSEQINGIDKSTYQMDFANRNEAIREVALDIGEGADFILVKPSFAYLDIIRDIKQKFHHPVLAYQVSGEYSMLIGNLDNMFESLIALKRAGCNAIMTYAALTLVKEKLVTRELA